MLTLVVHELYFFHLQSDSLCYLTFCLLSQFGEHLEIMGDAIDLTGDGGVIKTIVRRAKPDAIAPTDSLPLVDGIPHVTSVHDFF